MPTPVFINITIPDHHAHEALAQRWEDVAGGTRFAWVDHRPIRHTGTTSKRAMQRHRPFAVYWVQRCHGVQMRDQLSKHKTLDGAVQAAQALAAARDQQELERLLLHRQRVVLRATFEGVSCLRLREIAHTWHERTHDAGMQALAFVQDVADTGTNFVVGMAADVMAFIGAAAALGECGLRQVATVAEAQPEDAGEGYSTAEAPCGFCGGPMPCSCPAPAGLDEAQRADAEARSNVDLPNGL